jgi:hypothetical protein
MAMWTIWAVNCYRETSKDCEHRAYVDVQGKRNAKELLKRDGWHMAGGPGDNPYWICPACVRDMNAE